MSTQYFQQQQTQDLEANRASWTGLIGQLFYTTDLKEWWASDGATAGGVFIGSANISQAGADAAAIAATGSLAISPTKMFLNYLQRLTGMLAGSGGYTYTVTISRSKALPGAIVRINVELPASTNPTVQIEDLTGSVVLATVTTPNAGASAAYWWGDFQLGQDGAWHLTARGWN